MPEASVPVRLAKKVSRLPESSSVGAFRMTTSEEAEKGLAIEIFSPAPA